MININKLTVIYMILIIIILLSSLSCYNTNNPLPHLCFSFQGKIAIVALTILASNTHILCGLLVAITFILLSNSYIQEGFVTSSQYTDKVCSDDDKPFGTTSATMTFPDGPCNPCAEGNLTKCNVTDITIKGQPLGCYNTQDRASWGWNSYGFANDISKAKTMCKNKGFRYLSMECPGPNGSEVWCGPKPPPESAKLAFDECKGNLLTNIGNNKSNLTACTGPYTNSDGTALGGWFRGVLYDLGITQDKNQVKGTWKQIDDDVLTCTADEYVKFLGNLSGDDCLAAVKNTDGINYGVWRGDSDNGCHTCYITDRGRPSTWKLDPLDGAVSYIKSDDTIGASDAKYVRAKTFDCPTGTTPIQSWEECQQANNILPGTIPLGYTFHDDNWKYGCLEINGKLFFNSKQDAKNIVGSSGGRSAAICKYTDAANTTCNPVKGDNCTGCTDESCCNYYYIQQGAQQVKFWYNSTGGDSRWLLSPSSNPSRDNPTMSDGNLNPLAAEIIQVNQETPLKVSATYRGIDGKTYTVVLFSNSSTPAKAEQVQLTQWINTGSTGDKYNCEWNGLACNTATTPCK